MNFKLVFDSQINHSPSKQTYSFSRSKRFTDNPEFLLDNTGPTPQDSITGKGGLSLIDQQCSENRKEVGSIRVDPQPPTCIRSTANSIWRARRDIPLGNPLGIKHKKVQLQGQPDITLK